MTRSPYDQWNRGLRDRCRPSFAIEWNCEWKGDKNMSEKPDLEKFDPSEWEFATSITQRDAIRVMNEGGVVWSGVLQIYFRLRDDGVFCCFYTTKPWEWTPSALPNGGWWCIVVPRPKHSPAKPADPTAWWIEKTSAEWVHRGRFIRFPLTIKPEPKPRRRVTREEAIIAMIRDPEQMAWSESGGARFWWNKKKLCLDAAFDPGKGDEINYDRMSFLYLDPPEVEK